MRASAVTGMRRIEASRYTKGERIMKKLFAGTLLAIGLMLPNAAQAQSVPASDTLTVYDPQGQIFSTVSEDEAREDPSQILAVNAAIDENLFGQALYLTEPDGTKSDIFGICTCGVNNVLALGFASDTETTGVNFGEFSSTPEGNGIFDATRFLSASLRDQGYTATFTSDGAVPEPATWAMMLVGFGGIGVAMRRKRRTSTARLQTA